MPKVTTKKNKDGSAQVASAALASALTQMGGERAVFALLQHAAQHPDFIARMGQDDLMRRGRVESSTAESFIATAYIAALTQILTQQPQILHGLNFVLHDSKTIAPDRDIRYWYDLAFYVSHPDTPDQHVVFPINIKNSMGKTADNLCAESTLDWVVYGQIPKRNPAHLAIVKQDLTLCDYYFLVVPKQGGAPFVGSMKRWKTLKPNRSNKPFQTVLARSNLEEGPVCQSTSIDKILTAWEKSYALEAEARAKKPNDFSEARTFHGLVRQSMLCQPPTAYKKASTKKLIVPQTTQLFLPGFLDLA